MISTSSIKRRLVEQKQEAESILDQNLAAHEKQTELQDTLNAPLVKVIIGARRSGKTVLSLQSQKKQENDYYYINFDDEILGSIAPENLLDFLFLLCYIRIFYG